MQSRPPVSTYQRVPSPTKERFASARYPSPPTTACRSLHGGSSQSTRSWPIYRRTQAVRDAGSVRIPIASRPPATHRAHSNGPRGMHSASGHGASTHSLPVAPSLNVAKLPGRMLAGRPQAWPSPRASMAQCRAPMRVGVNAAARLPPQDTHIPLPATHHMSQLPLVQSARPSLVPVLQAPRSSVASSCSSMSTSAHGSFLWMPATLAQQPQQQNQHRRSTGPLDGSRASSNDSDVWQDESISTEQAAAALKIAAKLQRRGNEAQ